MAISYFPGRADAPSAAHYTRGFKVADTDDPARLAKGISSLVWSPCVWLQGHRTQLNFEFADWCVLDFDNGELTLEQAIQNFCDCVHVIGTTRNHQRVKGGKPAVDRFRVMLKFDERIDNLRLYRYQMFVASRHWPCDPACKDGARFFFPCTDIVSVSADGYTHEIDQDIPESFDRAPPSVRRDIAAGVVPRSVQRSLNCVIPVGERNTAVYGIAKDLRRCGFEAGTILHMILKSATYRETIVSPKLLKEINETVASACRKVELEGGPIAAPKQNSP